MALSDVAVPDGSEIRFDGELESIHEGVVLTGAAEVPWTGSCRRCLGRVDGTARIDVREVYETHPTEGETWPLQQDHVDLGPLLHDIALLALPWRRCAATIAGAQHPRRSRPRWPPTPASRPTSNPRRTRAGRPSTTSTSETSGWSPGRRRFALTPAGSLASHPRVRRTAALPTSPQDHDDGCPQEEDLQVQEPEPPLRRLAPRRTRAQRVPALRCRQAAPRGVRQLRLVSRSPSHRGRLTLGAFAP
jgi:hypothetical protein